MNLGGALSNLGRAPVPEWEEVARAAWPGQTPPALSKAAARTYLPGLLLGYVALLGAAWAGLIWLALAGWVLLSLLEWWSTAADPGVLRLLDLVGFRPQLRGLLRSVLVAALGFTSFGAPAGLAYVTAVLLLQLAWAAQPVLATWLSRSAPPLEYRPKSSAQPEPLRDHARSYASAVGTPAAVVWIELLAVVGLLVLGPQSALSTWCIAVAGFGALGWLGWTALRAVRLRRAQGRWGNELVARLAEAEPRYLVYVSLAARQSGYIANQWLPAFNRLPLPGIILAREASQLQPLGETSLPVIYAPTTRNVERLTLPSVKVAFYLAYGERNTTLLREPRLRHVMLAHGDSDKATSASALIRAFDETWVAGAAAVERFRAAGIDLPPERFALIGRPQIAGLPVGPNANHPKVLLYAPTFEGYFEQTTLSSLDVMGVELIRRLLRDHPEIAIWFRPHPSSGVVRPSMLAAIAEIRGMLQQAGPQHRMVPAGVLGLPECLAAADLLVSDVSSVVSDYLFTERPVLVCNPAGLTPEAFIAAYPSQASSYLLGPSLDELETAMGHALGDDPLRTARIAMKAHVLGNPEGGPQAALAANLERLCRSQSGG